MVPVWFAILLGIVGVLTGSTLLGLPRWLNAREAGYQLGYRAGNDAGYEEGYRHGRHSTRPTK